MKKTLVLQALVGMALVCGACERHDWSETKVLHQEHGTGHGAADGEHAKGGEHVGAEQTGQASDEKKAEH
jgi:hypothetical protein